MTLTPVMLSPNCCCHRGELIPATELCCAREWIKDADVGNGSVKNKDKEDEIHPRNKTHP